MRSCAESALLIAFLTGCFQVDVFQPVRTTKYEFPGNHIPANLVQEVAFDSEDGVPLAAVWAWQTSPSASPTALYLHGQAEDIDGAWGRIEVLWDVGYNVLALDYRGFGRSGGEPSESGLDMDGRAALAFAQLEDPAVEQRLTIWGFSLGTGVAAAIAPSASAQVLVLEAPFTSVPDLVEESTPFGIPGDWVTDVRFDTLDIIPSVKMPVVVAMGTDDSKIPNWMSQKVFDRAISSKRLVVVPGADHEQIGPLGMSAEVAATGALVPAAAP